MDCDEKLDRTSTSWRTMKKKPTPAPEDWQRAEERLRDTEATNRQLMGRLARSEAYGGEERERAERRRRLIRRLIPFAR